VRKLIFVLTMATGILPAGTVTYTTPANSSIPGTGAVSASVTFTTNTGTMQITLQDLLGNPTNVGQLISDLEYTLSVGGTSSLTSSWAQQTNVNNDGSVSPGVPGSTAWGFGTFAGQSILCAVCGNNSVLSTPVGADAGPAQLIIGPAGPGGIYTNANGSIAGNDPHNPFLMQTATFTISNPAITINTTVSNVQFSFGTTFGNDVHGTDTPEPSTYALMSVGILAGGLLRKKFARRHN
jgi:PEP-CTERM motif